MNNLFQPSLDRALNSSGDPLSGAKMYFYATGTISPQAVYTSATGTTPLSNPVVSSSAGLFPAIYLDPAATYRVKLTDSTGSLVLWDVDPVAGQDAAAVASSASAAASAASASTSAAAAAVSAGAAAINAGNIFATAAAGVSNGVLSTTSLVAGTGGTNGTFDVAFSGGAGSGAAARFTVAGGALVSISISSKGTGYTSAPTMSFAASTGLTGASATAVIASRTGSGDYFLVVGAGTSFAELYKNVSGTPTDQNIGFPSLSAITTAMAAMTALTIPVPPSLGATIVVPELGQMLKGDGSPVTTVGDAVATIIPLGGTSSSTFAYTGGGVYQVDENGVGYVQLVDGVNSAQSVGTFTLSPPFYVSACMGRDTNSTSSGLNVIANGGAQGLNIGFTASSSQANISSSRNGDFPVLNSRYGAVPLQTPTVLDFYLEAGQQSSWTNNSVRDTPDASPLAAGLRKVANTWTGADAFTGARLQFNLPTKGGLRLYGYAVVQGTMTLANRRAINEYLMKRAKLVELKANTYDMFAIVGDSIAMGVGDYTTSTSVPFGKGAQYLDTGCLIPLKDPMQAQWPDQLSLSGSFGPAFAKTWYDLTGTAACMINCANGTGVGLFAGTGLYSGGWLSGANVMPVAARKVRNAMGDVRGRLRAAIAYIGTNDRGLGKTQVELQAGFVSLRDRCRTYFGVPDLPLLLISADTAADGTESQFAVVRAAQAAVISPTNEGIYLVVPYQNYLASGHHATPTGNVHLDQFANNDIGTKAATAAASVLLY